MTKFRFQDLEIWKLAIEIADDLFDIAEGSGSNSKREFHQFVNIAKRSTFENANILILLNRRKIVTYSRLEDLHEKLDHLCRKITNFQKTLK
jgi:four helix bundle protein